MDEERRHRTFKREIAAVFGVGYFVLIVWTGWIGDPELVESRIKVLDLLTNPVFFLMALAFGLDSASTQFAWVANLFKKN